MTEEQKKLAAAVRQHALDNYETGGWDFLVECWDDSDIILCTGHATTLADAIEQCRQPLALMDERRREVEAEIF